MNISIFLRHSRRIIQTDNMKIFYIEKGEDIGVKKAFCKIIFNDSFNYGY